MRLVLMFMVVVGCRGESETQAGNSGESKRRRAHEIVDQMRGLSMQMRFPRSDGKPDSDSLRRDEIMTSFRRIGKEAVPAITRALADADVRMRRNAALVLIELAADWTGKPPVDTREAVPALMRSAADTDHLVRARSAHALAEMGPGARRAVPVLIKLLEDPEEGPRNTSAIALGRIGAPAEAAIPTLRMAARNDPKENVRNFSRRAILQIEQAATENDQHAE